MGQGATIFRQKAPLTCDDTSMWYNRYNMRRPEKFAATTLVAIRTTPDQHRRLKMAAVEEDMTIAEMIGFLLDIRDDRERRRAALQRHPLQKVPERYGDIDLLMRSGR